MTDIATHNLEQSIRASDQADIRKIAVTETGRFCEVVQYLGDSGLLDSVVDALQQRGFHQLMVSVEVFRELQAFLRQGMLSGTIKTSAEGNSVVMCGKGNASC